jgi:cell division septation protein DedD
MDQDLVPPIGGTVGQTTGSQASAGQTAARTNIPATNPTTEEIASSREKPAEMSSPAAGPSGGYGYAPTATPERVIVQISGKTPQRGRYYRLQIGSFSVRGNATRASNKLREFGLSPAFEEFQNKVRVVLTRVPGDQVISIAEKVGAAGFSEIWCREEL